MVLYLKNIIRLGIYITSRPTTNISTQFFNRQIDLEDFEILSSLVGPMTKTTNWTFFKCSDWSCSTKIWNIWVWRSHRRLQQSFKLNFSTGQLILKILRSSRSNDKNCQSNHFKMFQLVPYPKNIIQLGIDITSRPTTNI